MVDFTIPLQTAPVRLKKGNPCFIIAEMSGNHNHDFDLALKLIDAAKDAGADAIKLQTYTPDTLTIDCTNDYFTVKSNPAWSGKTLYELYEQAHTPWEWQPKLMEYAQKKDILLFSTPFDPTSVDFLEKMDVSLYKVASFEVIDIPLLKRIGATKKPVIISRGMSSIEDIELALQTLKEAGCPEIAILHCISSYPAKPEQMNLATIQDISNRFNVVSGISDHTLGTTIPVVSVGLGALIIEKHMTLSRKDGGPDAAFSLEPDEFKAMVTAVRDAQAAVGKVNYEPDTKESENLVFKKSIFVTKDIKQGEPFTRDNIRVIRPGYGLHPKHFESVLGLTSKSDLPFGTPLLQKDIGHQIN